MVNLFGRHRFLIVIQKAVKYITALFFVLSIIDSQAYAVDYSVSMTTDGPINISSNPDNVVIDDSEINVVTNCKVGYSLLLSTSTSDNNLYLNSDPANNNPNNHFEPTSKTKTLKDNPGSWGYYYSSTEEPSLNSYFNPVPSSESEPATIKTLEGTVSENPINDVFKIHYGANTRSDALAGTYTLRNDVITNAPGGLTYYLTANPYCVDFKIKFNQNLDGAGAENTDDTITGFPTEDDVTINFDSLIIPDKEIRRNGFIFEKWNTNPDGSGLSYFPGETLKISDYLNGEVTLYAIWRNDTAYLQNWSGCRELNTGENTTLIDERDNTVYNVAKLEDGNCWFLDNLALDLADTTVQNKLSSQNTNATDYSLSFLKGQNIGGTSDQYATSRVRDSLPDRSYSDPRIYTGEKDTIPESSSEYGNGNHKVGIYYNYCAVSAGSYCYGNGPDETGSPSGNATEDICPVGWHLPSGGEDGEFANLCSTLKGSPCNSSENISLPELDLKNKLSIAMSGIHSYGNVISQGSQAQYWTSTSPGDSTLNHNMKRIMISSTDAYFESYRTRDYGLTARCIINDQTKSYSVTIDFDENIYSITFMQKNGTTITATKDNNKVFLNEKEPYVAKAYAKENYTLSSWDVSTQGTLSSTTANPTTITISDNVILKVKSESTDALLGNIPTLQNFDCSAIPEETVIKLYDARDGKEYRISKLVDGKCWMLDNLALNLDKSFLKMRVNSKNTNATDYALDHLKGNLKRNPYKNPSGKYSVSPAQYSPHIIWERVDPASIPMYDPTEMNTIPQNGDPMAEEAMTGQWETGVFYNYCAASAGSYCYGKEYIPENDSIEAEEDICPAGWKLPNSITDYGNLIGLLKTQERLRTELYIPLSGFIKNDSLTQQGSCAMIHATGTQLEDSLCDTPTAENPTQSWEINVRCVFGARPFVNVHIDLDAKTKSITFKSESQNYDVTTTGRDVELRKDVEYNIIATPKDGHVFSGWSTTESGTLGSTDSNPTTYSVLSESTLSASSNDVEEFNVTVNLDEHTKSVGFYNEDLGVKQVTENHSVITLRENTKYLIVASFESGYAMNNWNTSENGAFHSDNTFNPVIYSIDNDAVLTVTSKELNSLQSFTPEMCKILNVGDTIELKDIRDNNTYKIGKLPDENCWLLDNLSLDISDPMIQANLNSNTTNAADETLSYLVGKKTRKVEEDPNGNYSTSSASTIWYPNNFDIPSSTSASYSDPFIYTEAKDESTSEDSDIPEAKDWKYGIYYNYCAATAGSYCYGNGNQSISYDYQTQYITEDICPSGWRLPTSGNNGEYPMLTKSLYEEGGTHVGATWAYSEKQISYRRLLHLPKSGQIDSSRNLYETNLRGWWWTKTKYNTNSAILPSILDSSIYLTNGGSHNYANNIRCILDQPNREVTVDFDEGVESVTFSNQSYTPITATPENPVVNLKENTAYDVTATLLPGCKSVNFEAGTNSKFDQLPYQNTYYIISGNASLLTSSVKIPTYNVTINFDEHVNSIGIYSEEYGAEQITENGTTTLLRENTTYTITASFDTGYTTDHWTTSENGELSRNDTSTITYTVTNDATLALTSKKVQSMQSFTEEQCNNMVIGETVDLYDNRDNIVYKTGKLQDNNCWLLDNLRLDIGKELIMNSLNSKNTNASEKSLSYLRGERLRDPSIDPDGRFPTDNLVDTYNFDLENRSYSAPRIETDNKDLSDSNGRKVGIVYDYCAATAASRCYGNGTEMHNASVGKEPEEDICPAGWKLPTGGSNGNYEILYKKGLNDSQTFSDSLRLYEVELDNRNNYLWAANQLSARSGYVANAYPGPTPSNNIMTYRGAGIRCILASPHLQDVEVNLDQNIESIVFENETFGTIEVTSNETIQLHQNVEYNITANTKHDSLFKTWSTDEQSTLGSTTSPTTTLKISGDTILTAISELTSSHQVTVIFDEHVNNINISNEEYGNFEITESNTSIELKNVPYIVTASLKEGYGVASWATTENGNLENKLVASTKYIVTGNDELSLTTKQYQYMQSFTENDCKNISVGDKLELIDIRDNTSYRIGKLDDNNCWLLDNLSIDLTDQDVQENLNSETTNASNKTLEYLKGIKARDPNEDPNGKYATSEVSKEWSGESYSFSKPLLNLEYKDTIPQDGDPLAAEAQAGNWKVGAYYNLCAVSAGSSCHGNDTDSGEYTVTSENVTEDICPANWRLPTVKDDSDYSKLTKTINNGTSLYNENYKTFRRMLQLPLSGQINTSKKTVEGHGSLGRFWSSSRSGSYSYIYLMEESTNYVGREIESSRQFGYSTRCILDPHPFVNVEVDLDQGISSITFENPQYGNETVTENSTVQLRENVEYTITANHNPGYALSSWTTSRSATLGSTTEPITNVVITGDASISATSRMVPEHEVTVDFDEYVRSISFYNPDYGVQQVTDKNSTILLKEIPYIVTASYEAGYGVDTWTVSEDGAIEDSKAETTQFSITGNTTLYLTSRHLDTMQSFTAESCNNLAVGETITLVDSRDNTKYTVGKLIDNKCWMLDNLALDLSDENILTDLNSFNTNATSTSLKYLKGVKTRNPSDSTSKYPVSAATNNWLSDKYNTPMVYSAEKNTISQGDDPLRDQVLKSNWKNGVYYNYCAVTAGSYCYNYNNAVNSEPNEDICPSNWRLPHGNSYRGDYALLTILMQTQKYDTRRLEDADYINFRKMFHLPLSGYFYGGYDGSSYYPPTLMGSELYSWSLFTSPTRINTYTYSGTKYLEIQNESPYNGLTARCVNDSKPTSNVRINLDPAVSTITISSDTHGTEILTSSETIKMYRDEDYTITAEIQPGYTLDSWTTSIQGSLSENTNSTTVYHVSDDDEIGQNIVKLTSYTTTVNLGPGVSSVGFYSETQGNQVATHLSNTVQLYGSVDYTIVATMENEHFTFNSWTISDNGSLNSTSSNPTTISISGETQLTVEVTEDPTAQIIYDSNGHTFESLSTTNPTSYYIRTENISNPQYSHTPNINDEGVSNGNYANNLNLNDVVTIPNATKLHIKITYQAESAYYDWLSFWSGNHPDYTASNNYASGVKCSNNTSGKYSGTTKTTIECTIDGDTVTFGFRSDGSSTYYGYYAVITGLNSNNEPVPSVIRHTENKEGAYAIPKTSENSTFLGWSEDQNATVPTYTSEEDVKNNLAIKPGDTKTLYAIYDEIYPVVVNFDSNITKIDVTNSEFDPIEITETNSTIYLHRNREYQVTATSKDGYWAGNWNTTENGILSNTNNRQTSFAVTGPATLSLTSEIAPPLSITYDGNGLTFDENQTNIVTYDSTRTTEHVDSLHSHTPNLNSDGTKSANYENSFTMNDVIKIDGATKLKVQLTWGGESASYDWVSLWAGNYPNYTAASNYGTGMKCGDNTTGKYGGGNYTATTNTVECDIEGDTVTFAFKSDGGGVGDGYGYYATVTGYNNNDEIFPALSTTYDKSIVTGSYLIPSSASRHDFLGWSEDKNATKPTYKTENDIKSKLHVINGNNVTLYAVYDKYLKIHFDANEGTGSMSDQTVKAGSSITLSNNNFARTNYTFEKWNTESDGTGASYNNRASFRAPSNTTLGQEVILYAQWLEHKTVTVNFDEHVRSVGFYSNIYGTQQVTESGSTVTLNAGVPYIISSSYDTGYSINSWTTTEAGTLTSANSAAASYTITDDATLTLTSKSVGSFANFTNQDCQAMNVGDTVYLSDPRDQSVYNIGKLADNKCWMLDNLNLDLTNEDVKTNLTSRTTNASDETLTYLKAGGGSTDTTSDKYKYAKAGVAKWTSSYSYSNPLINDASKDKTVVTYGNNNSRVGIYYNYCAASAGSYCFGDGTNAGTTTGNLEEDICPVGWRIPTGSNLSGNAGEYQILYNTLSNNSTNFRNSLSTPLSGNYYSGSTRNQNSVGYFWSSTRYNNNNYMYSATANSSSVSPSTYNYRYYGNSIRCLQIDQSETYDTIVNFDDHTKSIMLSNDTYGSQVVENSGETIKLHYNTPYTITAEMENGYEFTSWNTSEKGSLLSSTENPTTYTITGKNTLTASSVEAEEMNIIYNGNGLLFNNTSETNTVAYNANDKTVISGNYLVPSSTALHNFLGWSQNQNSETAEYTTEEEIKNNLLDYNGKTINLYAIYQKYLTIHYDGNNSDSGSLEDQTVPAGASINLSENGFTREGYTFGGWNTKEDGSGASYGKNATFIAPTDTTLGQVQTLYVKWLANGNVTVTFDEHVRSIGVFSKNYGSQQITESGSTVHLVQNEKYIITSTYDPSYGPSQWTTTQGGSLTDSHSATSYYTITGDTTLSLSSTQLISMTDFTSEQCDLMGVNEIKKLYDPRDNSSYEIIKIDNGHCWMRDNLTLDLNDRDVVNNITSENTNASADSIASLKNGNRENGEQYANEGLSYTEWMPGMSSYDKPLIATRYKNDTHSNDSVYDLRSTMFGNYYNYCAASAGSYCYGNGDNVNNVNDSIGNAIYDICPAGWRMPTDEELSYFFTPVSSYAANSNRKNLKLTLSGLIANGSLYYNGQQGNLWSSTNSNKSGMQILRNLDGQIVTIWMERNLGNSVRCILRSPNDMHQVSVKMDEGVSSVVFSNNAHEAVTATQDNKIVKLYYDSTYDVTVNTQYGATFANMSSTEGGYLDLITETNTTYRVVNDTTLNINTNLVSGTVTVNMDNHIGGVSFTHPEYGTVIATKENPTVNIKVGANYIIYPFQDPGYTFSAWSADNAIIGSTSSMTTTFTPTGTSTLTAKSTQKLYMQDFTQSMCDKLTLEQNTTVYDKRDNSAYTVARLKDGLCWMTSDLHLGSTSSTMTLTSADTDITDNYTLPIVETSSNKQNWKEHESHAYQYSTTKYLYSWRAATAGTSYFSDNSTTSICPANWKLLTRNQANNYLSSVNEVSGTTNTGIITNAPLSFTNGIYEGSSKTLYSNKDYWMAEGWYYNNVYYGYYFGINGSTVVTNYGLPKDYGLGIRCVLNNNTISRHPVTVLFDSNTTSVTFTDSNSHTQTATPDSPVVLLQNSSVYTITATSLNDNSQTIWGTTEGGAVGSTFDNPTTYVVTKSANLNVIHVNNELPPKAMLDTGPMLSDKIQAIAKESSPNRNDNYLIKELRMANSLPENFIPNGSNTVSVLGNPEYPYPVYAYFDNTDDSGIMYFYTEAEEIYMNPDSSFALAYNNSLVNLEALASWKTDNVTNMVALFSDDSSLENINSISGWNTENVTNMGSMFTNNSSLKNIDALSEWNTSSVTDMMSMFSCASKLENIDGASKWDTGNVNNMYNMFYYASSLANIDGAENWDTSKVTNMSYMFGSASALENIDGAIKWNTENVSNMSYMFLYATGLTNIDGASNWDTKNVTNMHGMFWHAESLENIDGATDWNTRNVTDMSDMFQHAQALTNIDGALNWNISNVTNMTLMFGYASSLANVDGALNWEIGNLTSLESVFIGTTSLANIEGLSNWNTSSITDMNRLFSDASALTNIDALSSWKTENVINMERMFTGARSLENINGASEWNTSSVTNMRYMFDGASSLADISGARNWDTSKVTDMGSMFTYISTNVDGSVIDNWNIDSVTNFNSMFGATDTNTHSYIANPGHPNFINRPGTWDSYGTFIPNDATSQTHNNNQENTNQTPSTGTFNSTASNELDPTVNTQTDTSSSISNVSNNSTDTSSNINPTTTNTPTKPENTTTSPLGVVAESSPRTNVNATEIYSDSNLVENNLATTVPESSNLNSALIIGAATAAVTGAVLLAFATSKKD